MTNLNNHLLSIIKEFNNKIETHKSNIDKERKDINKKIGDIIQGKPDIIKLSALNSQYGGLKLKAGEDGIDTLEKLNDLFAKLQTINPDRIEEQNKTLQEKTREILELLKKITSDDYTKKSLDDVVVNQNLLQKLDLIKTDITAFDSTLKIQTQLSRLQVPLNKIDVKKLLNTTLLNELLKKFKTKFEEIKAKPQGQSLDTDIEALRGEIAAKKTEIDTITTQIEAINAEFTDFERNFMESLELKPQDVYIQKLESNSDLLKIIVEKVNETTTKQQLKDELKPLITEFFRFKLKEEIKNEGKQKQIEDDNKFSTFDVYVTLYNKYLSDSQVEFIIQDYLKFQTKYNQIILKYLKADLVISDAIITKLKVKTRELPSPLFDGTETKTISNNIFKDTRPSLTALDSIKNLVKIGMIDPAQKELSVADFKDIYNPTFKQTGGATILELEGLMKEMNTTAKKYREQYVNYVRNTEMQNKFGVYQLMHSVYLLMIINSNLFTNGDYKIYKFLGRGMINFYRRIIDKLYKDLHAAPESIEEKNKPIVMEIRKKYYLTIVKLKKFLDKIVQELTPFDKIDISRCSDKVQENFIILNHFKTILEKYNETFMNKLTIYSRINDIKMSNIDPTTKVSDINLPKYEINGEDDKALIKAFKTNEVYKKSVIFSMASKLFISDYERRNIYAGYYLLANQEDINIQLFDKTKNELIKAEIPQFPDYTPSSTDKFSSQIYQKIYDEIKQILESNKTFSDKILDLEKIKKEKVSNKVKESIEQNLEKILKLNELKERKVELEDEIELRKTEFDQIFNNATLTQTQKKTKIEAYKTKIKIDELSKNYQQILTELGNPQNSETSISLVKSDIDKIIKSINLAISIILLQSQTVDEKIMWVRNYTCEANKLDCTNPTKHPSNDIIKTLLPREIPSECPFKTDKNNIPIPILKSYKFTEVFDSQNFPNNSDMTSYMCLNTRLSGGNSVCLITYGYSGTGKSYTLFGKQDDSGTIQGLLQSTLGKLDQLDKVYFRLFEIYGKGIPYPDYWYSIKDKKQITKENIYNYLYAYKLRLEPSLKEKIGVDKPNIINPEDVGVEFGVKLEKKEIEDFINLSNQANLSTAEYQLNKDGKIDKMGYLEIPGVDVKSIFESFDRFTTKIEEMRIKKQRVRETPNNNVSSRSILIYDFVLMVKIEGKEKPVNFLIIDLPGREEIAPTFINKYVDKKTNELMYDIIAKGFKEDKKINKDIIKNSEIYMSELKLMLECFTLNPVAVPIFSVEIMEDLLKKEFKKFQSVIDVEEHIEYNLIETLDRVPDGNTLNIKGNFGLLDEFISYTYDYRHLLTHDGELNLTGLLSAEIISKLKQTNISDYFKYKKELIDSGLGWLTLNNYITIKANGELEIIKRDEDKPFKLLTGIENWKKKFNGFDKQYNKENENPEDNLYSSTIKDVLDKKKGIKQLTSFIAARDKLYGLNVEQYKGRQIKILFFMYLIRRIIRQGRFDLLDLIYKKIIDEKINKYIEAHIEHLKKEKDSDKKIIELITQLIEKYNFKAEALKKKFIKSKFIENGKINKSADNKIKIKYDTIVNSNGILIDDFEEEVDFYKYIIDSIKYDFYTTGFEGIYINENIIGLIKYLGKDGKKDEVSGEIKYLIDNIADRELISIQKQNPKLILDYQIKISRLLMISKLEAEGEQLQSIDGDNDINIYVQNIIKNINLLIEAEKGATVDKDFIKKHIEKMAQSKQETEGTGEKSNYTEKGKRRFFKIKGDIPKQIYKKDPSGNDYGNYYYDKHNLDLAFELFNDGYVSSKIFCYDNPIIKSILEPYLLKINDFKIFYLFGNYTKDTRELKCAQQFELLETTNNFIEAITR